MLGSIARYAVGKKLSERSNTTFPIATMAINIMGAVLLGFINSIGLGWGWNLLLADGFLGAYTTFSTFMYEGFSLLEKNEKPRAILYVGGSLILGVIGFIAGFEAGRLFIPVYQ